MSKLSKRNKRITTAVAVVAIIGVGGGAAWAYWTATGHGSGGGTTGVSTDFTITSSAATGAALIPGIGSQSVAFAVTNPSAGTQNLTSVVVTVANADGSPWIAVPGCSAADYAVGTPTITYGPILTAGAATGTVSIAMNNSLTNQNACQGVPYPLYFAAS